MALSVGSASLTRQQTNVAAVFIGNFTEEASGNGEEDDTGRIRYGSGAVSVCALPGCQPCQRSLSRRKRVSGKQFQSTCSRRLQWWIAHIVWCDAGRKACAWVRQRAGTIRKVSRCLEDTSSANLRRHERCRDSAGCLLGAETKPGLDDGNPRSTL